ncbi:hypothetical protein SBRY_20783 [Actinacidiphila bryophytorum]|uniref:Uncharacterized protein n=1 Tax=Actinacidiphila bryophytorum TaxID=1436133 RepID=A0A9W4EDV9_9ACTN|nr:hypothetical protein SBRY_20783 [Actinacidiphila bryophytorum]
MADAAASAAAQDLRLPDRGHREHGRTPWWRPGRGTFPAGVRGRGHHVGAPGHRRSCVQRGRTVGLHPEGRYGLGGAHPGGAGPADRGGRPALIRDVPAQAGTTWCSPGEMCHVRPPATCRGPLAVL